MVSAAGAEGDRSKRTVAIVDHDQAVRESFSVLLSGVGYSVHTFDSGLALINSLPLLRPHCLLLEFHLPELNGQAVVDRLADLGHSLPTVLMASHPRAVPGLVELGSNAVDILHKPIEEIWLAREIEAHGAITTAGGNLALRYRSTFYDYAKAETSATYRFPPRGIEGAKPKK